MSDTNDTNTERVYTERDYLKAQIVCGKPLHMFSQKELNSLEILPTTDYNYDKDTL